MDDTQPGHYYMMASMDIEPGHEANFHEVYNTEHVPSLARVPGILEVVRLRPIPFRMSIGGATRDVEVSRGEPSFAALYTLESPLVLESDAFGRAVEDGRWPSLVRPYTTNRRHLVFEPFDGT